MIAETILPAMLARTLTIGTSAAFVESMRYVRHVVDVYEAMARGGGVHGSLCVALSSNDDGGQLVLLDAGRAERVRAVARRALDDDDDAESTRQRHRLARRMAYVVRARADQSASSEQI